MTNFEMLCELLPADINWGDPITPQMVAEIVMAEREACATVCEKSDRYRGDYFAAKIRERSNALGEA